MYIETESAAIIRAIREAGEDAVVMVNDVGEYQDVLVWESEEESQDDIGEHIAGRWAVSADVAREIRASGIREIR